MADRWKWKKNFLGYTKRMKGEDMYRYRYDSLPSKMSEARRKRKEREREREKEVMLRLPPLF